MKQYQFKGLLQTEGWIENAYVTVDEAGKIQAISNEQTKEVTIDTVNGYALPGFQNAHSHAFQYAMAGLAEKRAANETADDFWSWRETMYQLALTMSPEDLESIATMLYAEMVRHGYTHVAEFHYLHHDKDGKTYAHLAEHGERLVAAAQKAGINITLVPMFYQKGGFGMDPQPKQRRFISKTTDQYFNLLEASQKVVEKYPHATLGFGIHSLRAVEEEAIRKTLEQAPKDLPFHIHIAEQLKEVEDAQVWLKQRPVDWLIGHTEMDESFHLVHATHLTESEIEGITRAGAQVVLCPSTEGNLGDGLFPFKQFQQLEGKWSIGTDSHIGLNPLEELRLLDYGQRLTTHRRDTFITDQQRDSGGYGIHQTLVAGRKAMGNENTTYFKVGEPFDAIVYDADFPLLAASSPESLLSTIVYAADSSATLGTLVNGKWIVKANQHTQGELIKNDFVKVMKGLKVR